MSNENKPAKKSKPLMYKILNIIGIVITVLLIPLVVINMTMAIQGLTNPDVPPNFMGYTPLIVSTGSMNPTFDAQDLVIVKAVGDPDKLEVGDIISYFSGDSLITHRIVEITSTKEEPILFVTQGDYNNTADSLYVTPAKVFGTYITHFKDLGGFALFMQTPTGMLLLVVLPILLMFSTFYLIDRHQYKKALQEQKKEEIPAEQ